MIVIDASAVIDVLLGKPGAAQIMAFMGTAKSLHAPHLLDIEVAQVIRRHAGANMITAATGNEALANFANLTITRYPHGFLLARIWALRHNVSAYDAAYVALAEALGAKLLTRDARMKRSPAIRAGIVVI